MSPKKTDKPKPKAWVRKKDGDGKLEDLPQACDKPSEDFMEEPQNVRDCIAEVEKRQEKNLRQDLKLSQIPGAPPPSAGVVSEVMLITPQMARDWLERNVHNRNISDKLVEKFMIDMKTGKWELTHQGIGFDVNQRLIDGQHRLWAIYFSEVSVRMLVTYNLPPEAMSHIDTQRVRSVADMLKLEHDMPNPRKLSARCAVIRDIETPKRAGVPLSIDQTLEIYGRHKAGVDWSLESLHTGRIWTAAPIAGALAYAYPTNPELIADFATRLKTGEGLQRGDPAYTLREYFLRNPDFASATHRKVAILITLRATSSFCRGEEFSVIRPAVLQGIPMDEMAKFFRKPHTKKGEK
jgi:hypothetical protein